MLQITKLAEYLGVARECALLTWETAIKPHYRGDFAIHEKESDGPATDADIAADRFITEYLQARFPTSQFGYLTEESEADSVRLQRHKVWIIDPIDGTSDFIRGEGDFAVHIGMAARLEEDGPFLPVLGVVYHPIAGQMYLAARGLGAFVEDVNTHQRVPLQVSNVDTVAVSRLIVTKSNMSDRFRELIAQLAPATIEQMGSLGLKLCQVASGRADFYINISRRNCKEWDACAPDAILREAGGLMSGLDGSPITYNNPDFVLRHGILATNQLLHGELLDSVAFFQKAGTPNH